MTTPQEEIYAVSRTRQLLRDLIDPSKTPRVPKSIREEARGCLRHYPFGCHDKSILWGLQNHYKMRDIVQFFEELENEEPNEALIAAVMLYKAQREEQRRNTCECCCGLD